MVEAEAVRLKPAKDVDITSTLILPLLQLRAQGIQADIKTTWVNIYKCFKHFLLLKVNSLY